LKNIETVNMSRSETVLIAIGGGEFSEAQDIIDTFLGLLESKRDPIVTIMTVATSEPTDASGKYNRLFRKLGIKHVNTIDVSQRDDTFDTKSVKKIEQADAIFFTGGDQLNVTSLLGGSPLHNTFYERIHAGVIVVGTSAGAAMMSNSMLISGRSDNAPMVGGVEIAPGMDLVSGTMIDTHFSQRGRHGRLLTAVAHYPQDLGIGIDERTAIVIRNGELKVIGEGVATIMDGSKMHHSNLSYRKENEPLAMFEMVIHVLPSGYRYDLKERQPLSPNLKSMKGINRED